MFKKSWIVAAFVLVLLPLGMARAAEFASNRDNDIIVPATETHRNFYTASQKNVTVDGPTLGDLAVAAQTVVVNGNVGGSLFAVGRTINVRGDVGNHLRVAGEFVTISGHVSGDVMIAGAELTIASDAVIDGSVYGAATDLRINGVVKGEVKASATNLMINGSTGSVVAYSAVQLGKTAKVSGNLTYHLYAEDGLVKADGATIAGSTRFVKSIKQPSHFAAYMTVAGIAALIGWFVLGLLIISFLLKMSQKVIDRAFSAPAAAIGYGFGLLVVLPIIGVILAISIIGLPITLLLFLIWLFLLMLGGLFGKIALGAVIYKLFAKDKPYTVNWTTLLIGLVGSVLIGFVPLLGGLAKFAFMLLGVGAFSQVLFSLIRPESNSSIEAK